MDKLYPKMSAWCARKNCFLRILVCILCLVGMQLSQPCKGQVLVNDNVAVCPGDTVFVSILTNDTLPNGMDSLWIDAVPSLGVAGISATTLWYVSDSIGPRVDSLSYGVRDTLGDTTVASVYIMIRGRPAVNLGTDTAFCAGDSVMLDAGNPGGAYLWSSGDSNQTIYATGPGLIWVAVTDSAGCIGRDTITVIAHALPIVQISAQDASPCAGDTLELWASGGVTYTFTDTAGMTSIVDSLILPWPMYHGGSYFVEGIDTNGCRAQDSVVVTVNPVPIVGASSNSPICTGDTLILAANGVGLAWVWSGPHSLINPVLDTILIASADTTYSGIYHVVGTDTITGCTSLDSVSILINLLPVVNIVSNSPVCEGDTLRVHAVGALSQWNWAPPNANVQSDSIVIVSCNQGDQGSYAVTGTDTHGCKATASDSIVVHPLPAIDLYISRTDSVSCMGNVVNFYGFQGVHYDLFDPSGNVIGSSGSPSLWRLVPALQGQYSLIGTDIFGCRGRDSARIVIDTLPFVDAGIDTTLDCNTNEMTLHAGYAPIDGHGVWETTNGIRDSLAPNTLVILPNRAGEYQYVWKIADGNGCINRDTVKITVRYSPETVETSPVSYFKCIGGTLAGALQVPTQGMWLPHPHINFVDVTLPNTAFTSEFTQDEVVEWEVTNSSGCSTTSYVNLKFKQIDRDRGFSPNGDDKNDYFEFEGLENVSYLNPQLQVFSIWGTKVLDKNPYANDWDGKSQPAGEECSDGVYYYVLRIDGCEEILGSVTIRRNPKAD